MNHFGEMFCSIKRGDVVTFRSLKYIVTFMQVFFLNSDMNGGEVFRVVYHILEEL